MTIGLFLGGVALAGTPAPAMAADATAHAAALHPSDPSFPTQWGIAKAHVNDAWYTTSGSPSVIVAVVDTGVQAMPDLAGRLLPGYDFVNKDSNATDDNGHGTMAAGVIAATANNKIGIAGICGYCKILPVKVLDAKGGGSYADIGAGIRYAADHHADVISLSLGGNENTAELRADVAYAVAKGSLLVAAAGNAGKSVQHFPAAIPTVLAVGGSTADDKRYSWSNYGSSWVDIAAPGCNPAQARNGTVGQYCGTSSAAPFVSGVAALLASTYPKPAASVIRTALMTSADPIAGNWVNAASGRINAAAALKALPSTSTDHTNPVTSFVTPAAYGLVRGVVSIGASATDNVGVSRVELLAGTKVLATDTTAPYVLRWASGSYTGWGVLTLRAYDRAGNVAVAKRSLLVDNTLPAVLITKAPANGTRTIRGTVYVSAAASDAGGLRTMELIVNGKVVQRSTATKHTFAVSSPAYGTVLKVLVRAYDRAGNASLTPARTWSR
jgi:subtilisin family serine protease